MRRRFLGSCRSSLRRTSATTATAIAHGGVIVPAILVVASFSAGCSDQATDRPDAGDSDAGDAGPPWVVVRDVPTDVDLFGVWGRSASDVWAVGWGGMVVHFDGLTWSRETTTATVPLTAVHGIPQPAEPNPATGPGPVFATGWRGALLFRNDASRSWSSVAPIDGPKADLFALHLAARDNGLAVGDRGQLLNWDGTVWAPAKLRVPSEFGGFIEPKGTLKGVWAANASTYFVSGSGGAAYRSTSGFGPNACQTAAGVRTCPPFSALDTRISDPLRGIWGTSAQNVYTVGLESLILRFSGSWSRVRNNGADELPAAFLFGVSGSGASDITIVGWRGTIFRFDGRAWTQEVAPTESDLRAVWVDPVSKVAYAVGASGLVLRRDPPPPPPTDAGP